MPFSRENRHVTLSLVLIVTALMLVGVGAQAYLAQQDSEARQHENVVRDQRDQAYARCLTDFAADLVDSIDARATANAELNAARDEKDRLLDALLRITARAQASGAESQSQLPPALVARYEHVLAARVKAQRHYDAIARRVEAVQERNPYVSPKVVCTR